MAKKTVRRPSARRGLSIHIGLNSVSPAHYEGWSGDLAACEFDAKDILHVGPAGLGWLLAGRAHVSADDVKALAHAVFRHRILINYRAEAEGVTVEKVIERILQTVEAPNK